MPRLHNEIFVGYTRKGSKSNIFSAIRNTLDYGVFGITAFLGG